MVESFECGAKDGINMKEINNSETEKALQSINNTLQRIENMLLIILHNKQIR